MHAVTRIVSVVIAIQLSLTCHAASVKLEPNARWRLEFPELPDTLANMVSGERQPARLTVRLPANYSREGRFPLFVFLNGGDGGRGDTLPLDRTVVGSNDYICVNLPLFKRALNKTDGPLVTTEDFETVSACYRRMLEKLMEVIPNVSAERSVLGGFSNGAHTTALLLAGGDEFTLRHFRAFYFVEGGSPIAVNALHRAALKRCRFLWMHGERGKENTNRLASVSRVVEQEALARNLDFTFVTMKATGHEFPAKYQRVLGKWICGELSSATP